MPSAFPYKRTRSDDIRAIISYTKNKKIALKDRKLAALARPELSSYFMRYRQFFQTPENLLPNKKLRKLSGFLYQLYGSKAACFSYINDVREPEDLGACLYCGLPKNITVDHYLPRDLKAFPHLSTLSANLVSACSSCQNSKSNFFPKSIAGSRNPSKGARRASILLAHKKEIDNQSRGVKLRGHNRTVTLRRLEFKATRKKVSIVRTKRIVHPYFDDFVKNEVFDLLLSWKNDKPKIEKFIWRQGLSSAQRALLSYHLEKLHVKDRSTKPIGRVHKAFLKALSEGGITPVRVREQANFMLTYYREKAGISNAIEAAFFRALLLDEARVTSIANKLNILRMPLISESKSKAT